MTGGIRALARLAIMVMRADRRIKQIQTKGYHMTDQERGQWQALTWMLRVMGEEEYEYEWW